MSRSSRIEVLVEATNQGGKDFTTVLGRGESINFRGTDTTVHRIEVRPAEDADR